MKDMQSDITKKIIESIKNDLKKFDIILVFVGSKDNVTKWINCFHKSKKIENTLKRILILSDTDIPHIDSCVFEHRKINEDEREGIERLYAMYDFSEHFFVISDNQQYGGLINYVKIGAMTAEEIFQVLLI